MKKIIFSFITFLLVTTVNSQQISKDDYARAVSFGASNLFNKSIYNIVTVPTWNSDSSGFVYGDFSPKGRTFMKWQFTKKLPEQLFDHEILAKILSDSLKNPVKANDIQIQGVKALNNYQVEFSAGNKTFLLDTRNYTLTRKIIAQETLLEKKSPDGKWTAFMENYNLHIRNEKTGEKKQLSFSGQKNFEYGSWYGWSDIIEGENGDRPKRFSVQWSADSKWIQTFICDLRSGNKMFLLDWSIDSMYRPKLLSYYRASPGDTGMVHMVPVFFNVETGEEIRRDVARSTHTFPARYQWSAKNPGIIYEEFLYRGFQEVHVKEIDVNLRKERMLYHETSKTNIDGYLSELTEDIGKIIITSEKNGWRQLYSVDLKDGSLRSITTGDYRINNIVHIDTKNNLIYFTAAGKEQGNPYYNYLYRVSTNGKDQALLTPEFMDHQVYLSPDQQYFIDNRSAFDHPTETVIRNNKGVLLQELMRANIDSLKKMNYKFPEQFTAIARDGVTTIYGVVHKPSNFDPAKKYPVIDQSYTGPHTFMFPRTFQMSLARSNQALAELGFVVVTIDGMGTSGRSKSFQSVSYKNMGQNLIDHVIAIKSLGRKYPWIDTTRVGIFGHSAGGYDAGHAVLEFPDFYKVAVASSADHDFRMEKDWWPEMYMGWPVDSTYNKVSNITMAPNLKGKLLITHGGIDENVNPSATFKLAEALIKANKEFDMLIFPSQRHGYSAQYNDYFTKKKWNYFVEHLSGNKPIWDFPMK